MITILIITFHVGVQLVFPGVIPGWAGSSVVMTIDLSPPPQWLVPPNQHCHCSVLWCSRRSFWMLFPENCSSVFCRASCINNHLNATSLDPVWNVNAYQVGDTARPPSACPLLHSRDSVGTTVQLCGADFASHTCFWAGIVDHVHLSPRLNQAGRGDLNRPVLRPGYMAFASHRCNGWRHSSGPSIGSPRAAVWIRWTLLRYLLRSPA